MEIREYLRVLRRRAWIPLLLVVVTMAATTLAVYLSKPEYTATATVVAKSPASAGSNSLSFQQVVASNTMALQVRRELRLDKSVADLSAAVGVNAGKSNAYAITYTDANADRAVAVANQYANDAARAYQQLGGAPAVSIVKSTAGDLQTYRDRYLATSKATQAFRVAHPEVVAAVDAATARANGNGNTSPPAKVDQDLVAQYQLLVLDEHVISQAYQDINTDISAARIAELNNASNWDASVVDQAVAKPDTSTRLLKVAYAAVLALIMGIGIVLAVEYFDNTVREPEEAEEIVGAPVIGIIPRGTARTLKPARGGAA